MHLRSAPQQSWIIPKRVYVCVSTESSTVSSSAGTPACGPQQCARKVTSALLISGLCGHLRSRSLICKKTTSKDQHHSTVRVSFTCSLVNDTRSQSCGKRQPPRPANARCAKPPLRAQTSAGCALCARYAECTLTHQFPSLFGFHYSVVR